MSPKISFVGVGRMGANMARRLKDCGFTITVVYDRAEEIARELAEEIGTRAVTTLAEATAAADVIFTVVTDDAAQRAVFAEEGDSLLASARGKIFVNCATLTPAVHVEMAQRVESVGGQCLEACMASSITQARHGTLYLMCAGEKAVFEKLQPVLEKLSEKPRYVGEAGQAAQVKALVNMLMNINTAGLAEGLGLGNALGLDLTLLREIFAETGAASRVLQTDGEDMQNREHECYFSAAHAAKDSTIAWKLGVEAGLQLPLSAAVRLQYERLVALGLGDLDKSGVSELTFKDRAW